MRGAARTVRLASVSFENVVIRRHSSAVRRPAQQNRRRGARFPQLSIGKTRLVRYASAIPLPAAVRTRRARRSACRQMSVTLRVLAAIVVGCMLLATGARGTRRHLRRTRGPPKRPPTSARRCPATCSPASTFRRASRRSRRCSRISTSSCCSRTRRSSTRPPSATASPNSPMPGAASSSARSTTRIAATRPAARRRRTAGARSKRSIRTRPTASARRTRCARSRRRRIVPHPLTQGVTSLAALRGNPGPYAGGNQAKPGTTVVAAWSQPNARGTIDPAIAYRQTGAACVIHVGIAPQYGVLTTFGTFGTDFAGDFYRVWKNAFDFGAAGCRRHRHRPGRFRRRSPRAGRIAPSSTPGATAFAFAILLDGAFAAGRVRSRAASDHASRRPHHAPDRLGECRSRSSRRCGAARRARLTLAHGSVETPVFMPVGTYGTVKAMSPAELDRPRRADHPRQHVPPLAAARAPT